MGLKHARMLCQKLNIVTEKIELVSRASVYEYYFFSTESTVDIAEEKLKRIAGENVFTLLEDNTKKDSFEMLTIFTITFQRPAQMYLFQRIIKTNMFETYHKFTIPSGKNPVYFLIPSKSPFFTDFSIHIANDKDNLTVAELYMDRYSIVEDSMQSTFN